ncbi:uncharacterized protein LOC108089712 isoform X2 [Drosophila ficusphila]|uniref:uncharacterized protein LOC108089712 isoform X2 n=1 Tax=Drosophila ficusphila TaxID=30025 RepID=UPI0007E72956|nr:uncharacterized protein LOC108089712 isoform X2 [Drosophila ficusphila]
MNTKNRKKPTWDDHHGSGEGNKLRPNKWDKGGLGNFTTKYNHLALLFVGIIGAALDFFIRNKKAKKQILNFFSLLAAFGNLLMVFLKPAGGRGNRRFKKKSTNL